MVLSLIFVCFLCKKSNAIPPETSLVNQQYITPDLSIKGDYTPKSFSNNNNLALKPGAFYFAKGESLILDGIVADIDDVAIRGAKVKIWQTNANGVYNDEVGFEGVGYDKNFTESGTYITDEIGRFRFLTVIPKEFDSRAPFINITVEKEGFKTLRTKIFLSHHPKNDTDPEYKKLSYDDKKLVTATVYFLDTREKKMGKRAVFNVVLNGSQEYVDY